jgi:hypothetical protein
MITHSGWSCVSLLRQEVAMPRKYAPLVTVLIFSCLLATLIMPTAALVAEDLDSATVRGRIHDSSGAIVPQAIVTIRDISRHRIFSTVPDTEGQFALAVLPPGSYALQVEAKGFRRFEQDGIHLESGQTMALSITLEIGRLEHRLLVLADAPVLDLSRTVVGGTLDARRIDAIPLNGGDPLDLVFLFPGVSEQPFDTRDAAPPADRHSLSETPIEAGIFSLSGGRAFSNNLTLDGLDNNDDREARERISYSREAIEEVQVITNQFSAEYGRASGGRVNLRTRSGSNQFHGRANFFFQDESLNANSFFRNMAGEPRTPYQRRQQGVSVSGPVRQNRVFFFASYERDDTPDSAEVNILLPLQTNPRFPLPQPNLEVGGIIYQPSSGPPILGGRYVDEVQTPSRRDFLMGRIDAVVSDRHNLWFRYDLSKGSSLAGYSGGSRFPSTAVARGRDSQSWAVSENYVIRPKLISQFRFQYSRLLPLSLESSGTFPVAVVVSGSPGFSAGGSSSSSSSGRRSQRRELREQITDSFTWVKGRSTLRWGMDVQHVDSHDFDLFEFNGIYTFSNLADFLNNQPSRFQQSVGNPEGRVINTVLGFYVQEDLHVRPNWTLNFGLRYDRETALSHDNNNVGPRVSFTWDPLNSGKTVVRGGFGVFYNRVLLRTFGEFAGKSGLRFVDLQTPADVQGIFPHLSSQDAGNFLSDLFPRILPNTAEVFAAASPASDLRRIAPDLRIPYSEQASLGIEREIRRGWIIEAVYQFNRGVSLWRDHNINAPVPPSEGLLNYLLGRTFSLSMDNTLYSNVRFDLGTNITVPAPNNSIIKTPLVLGLNARTTVSSSSSTRFVRLLYEAVRPLRPFPDLSGIDQLESSGSSDYNAFTLSVSRQAGRRNVFHASYTLSKLLEDTFINTATAQDEFNLAAERSLGNTDQRHRFIFQGVFELPKLKITLAPVLMFASGRPFTIGNGGSDRNLSDRATDRPNLLQPLASAPRLTDRPGEVSPLDPKLFFALATIGTSGNLGRNVGVGPAQRRIDLAVSRDFKIKERIIVHPQVEVFNLFNNVIFFVNGYVDITDSDFLQPRAARKPRVIQLSLRMDF